MSGDRGSECLIRSGFPDAGSQQRDRKLDRRNGSAFWVTKTNSRSGSDSLCCSRRSTRKNGIEIERLLPDVSCSPNLMKRATFEIEPLRIPLGIEELV